MCGIAGFLQDSVLSDGAAALVARMGDTITNRGPDDSGAWLDREAGIALAHRRLSIIDLSPAGHQPMISRSGRFVISYNGEIYNFREIRRDLDKLTGNGRWRGGSDTEVLLAAIDQWGVRGALERLNGMFAFAVWDRQTRVLTLARDRMGEKPLYYGSSGGVFLFGSELKALQEHPAFEGQLDRDSLSSMLRYDYVPAPHTIWQGIFKLEPAHYVEIGEGGQDIGTPVPYWSLRDTAAEGSASPLPNGPELMAELEALLRDSVGQRMVADVPLGAFLSGGIDSSLIVALMQAQSNRPVRTFTIGFEVTKFDEAPHAKSVAAHLGTDHTELYVTAQDALNVIPRLPAMWDEPFGDSSQIPTYLVSAMSRRDVTVALSGDGGDELFGGYARYRSSLRIWRQIQRWPLSVRTPVATLIKRAGRSSPSPGPLERVARVIGSRSFEDLYELKVSRAQDPDLLVFGDSNRARHMADAIPFLACPREKMLYRDLLYNLPDDILTKVDRAAMAVSLEVRAPFLDHRLVELAWRLPMSAKLSATNGKLVLQRLLQRYLPARLVDRPKMGFSVPVESWLRGPLRPWAEDLLSEDRLSRQGVLDPAAVRRLWRDFLSGRPRHDRILWNLLMFQEWFDTAGQTIAPITGAVPTETPPALNWRAGASLPL